MVILHMYVCVYIYIYIFMYTHVNHKQQTIKQIM